MRGDIFGISLSFEPLQKYRVNGDKVGSIVSNDFLHSGLNATPLFVIPVFAGMTKGGEETSDGLNRKSGKR